MRPASVLPNSSPEILRAMQTQSGVLRVRWVDADDSHALFYTSSDGETLLASHHNGFSCYALAKRLISGDRKSAAEQAEYIVACGGRVPSLHAVLALVPGGTHEPT